MYSTTGAGAAYTAGAGDDFGSILEVNNRWPPLLSSALDRTVLGIFGRSQEVSDCCLPFLSPACVIDRRAFVGSSRTSPQAGAWPNFSLAPLAFMGFDDEAQDGLSLGVHGALPLDPVLLKCSFNWLQ